MAFRLVGDFGVADFGHDGARWGISEIVALASVPFFDRQGVGHD